MIKIFPDNPIFVKHENAVKELYALSSQGLGDSPQADDLRERMDSTFSLLAYDEQDHLEGLAADLYMLSDEEIWSNHDPSPEGQRKLNQEMAAAREVENWSLILALFRKGNNRFKPDQLAYLRGRAYEHLGRLHTASLFFRKASELDYSNAAYKICLLTTLEKLSDVSATLDLAQTLLRENHQDHRSAIFAASIKRKLVYSQQATEPLNSELISIVEKSIAKERSLVLSKQMPDVILVGYSTLAGCYEDMGNPGGAMAAWTEALSLPGDHSKWLFYVGRAQVLLRIKEQQKAITDFEKSLKYHPDHPYPYLYLANWNLINNNFGKAISLADAALNWVTRSSTQARLWEIKAVAQAELGVSSKAVRRAFKQAVELDPTNDRIKRNAQVFEERQKSSRYLNNWTGAEIDDRDAIAPADAANKSLLDALAA